MIRGYSTWMGDLKYREIKTGFCRKNKCKPVLLKLSLAGNLEKPLISLYGTEWSERCYGTCLVALIMAMISKRRRNEASILTSFPISKRKNEPAYSRTCKDRSEANPAYSTPYKDRSEFCVYSINSKDRSGANSVYSTIWTDRSEAKSVYSTNSKERSGANSVYSTNWTDRSKVCLFHKFEWTKRSELGLFQK